MFPNKAQQFIGDKKNSQVIKKQKTRTTENRAKKKNKKSKTNKKKSKTNKKKRIKKCGFGEP